MENMKQELEDYRKAIEEVSNKRAAIILADEPEHVEHFMKPIDDVLKKYPKP